MKTVHLISILNSRYLENKNNYIFKNTKLLYTQIPLPQQSASACVKYGCMTNSSAWLLCKKMRFSDFPRWHFLL